MNVVAPPQLSAFGGLNAATGPNFASQNLVALLVQRCKRFIPIDLVLYLPTPDQRVVIPDLSEVVSTGTSIKYYRLTKGLTQKELARLAGISKAYLVYMEKDKYRRINPLLIKQIATVLDIDPLKLFPSIGKLSKHQNLIDYIIPPTSLGAKIKNLRLKQSISQKELIKRLKLSKDCLWRYEKDIAKPNRRILANIAKQLKVSIGELTETSSGEVENAIS